MGTSKAARALHAFSGYLNDGEQRGILERCYSYYEDHGLIRDGDALSLCDVCEFGAECWEPLKDQKLATKPGGIHLPWVGPEYSEAKIAVLATNLRGDDAYGIDVQWSVMSRVLDHLEKGAKKGFGGHFHRGVGAYVSAVLAAAHGDVPKVAPPIGSRIGVALRACALLECVKCSPPTTAMHEPAPPMWDHCPWTYLEDELEILQPRHLIVLGVRPLDVITHMLSSEKWERHGHFRRERSKIKGEPVEIYYVAHPGYRRWQKDSYSPLAKSLS